MAAAINESAFPNFAGERYNIYSIIHKALRGYMTDTLHTWGRMDVQDDCERAQAIAQLRQLLIALRSHLGHEDEFVHPAIERTRHGGSPRTAQEHLAHQRAITALSEELANFESAPPNLHASLAHALYLHLSVFVAENFEHMTIEETENHAALVAAYNDQEVLEIEHRIVASLSPEESASSMHWMLRHVNASERVFLLGGIKQNAPPAVFDNVLNMAREALSQRDMYKLEKALEQR